MRKLGAFLCTFSALFAFPFFAFAHEVYVLTPAEVASSLSIPPFDMFALARLDLSDFLFWAGIGIATVVAVFFISVSRRLERTLDPLLARMRRFAAPVARVTIGLSFLAAAYYQASYGPELPLAASFGQWSLLVTAILVVIGMCIVAGVYVRTAAFAALVLFSIAVWDHGMYMLTYTNYLGEILVLLILGAHHGITQSRKTREGNVFMRAYGRAAAMMAPYSMLLLRVCFGISLLFASLYAKVLHNNLALMVAQLPLAGHAHGIAYYFGLEPHFMVLGAAIIEIVIALFFILGIEIRFTSLFLEFWLALSLCYFGEAVWPHVILIGIPIAFILYGYDKYSLEGFFFKRNGFEPVL